MGQTAVLSVILVLVGMMFLVPSTEKALATIHAIATGKCATEIGSFPCEFKLDSMHLEKGTWVSTPTQSGTSATWSTAGNPQPGDEKGSVTYRVKITPGGSEETAILSFDNPLIGSNKCGIKGMAGWCNAGSGYNAEFTYLLVGPGAEGYFHERPPHNK
ncbi:MAG: hypothetical protein WA364_09055 [Candidatus Nitrosopolaris sp.]